jgi:hypothetical protein
LVDLARFLRNLLNEFAGEAFSQVSKDIGRLIMVMSKVLYRALNFVLSVVLVGILSQSQVLAMGMDWGDGGDGDDTSCTPDATLVITPGPIGSPVRITALDAQNFLIADYSRNWIYKVGLDGVPAKLFETNGSPLSVVFQPGNKSLYYVGNDRDKTIDIYRVKKGNLKLKDKLSYGPEGVQALDLAYDTSLQQLFVVDGLAREIKVLLGDGSLVRSFGGDMVLANPKGIAVDAEKDEVFVSDYGDPAVGIPASIKVFNLSGALVSTITGNFSRPQGLSLTDSKLFVADNMLAQILEFDRATNEMTTSYGCLGSSEGHMLLPLDVALDAAGLNLYVADNRNMRVTVLPLTESQ